MKRTLNFKSKEAYRKWLAYGNIRTKSGAVAKSDKTTIFAKTPGYTAIKIKGKVHKVKHY